MHKTPTLDNISPLTAESLDNAVELDTLEVQGLLARLAQAPLPGTEAFEVLHSLGALRWLQAV